MTDDQCPTCQENAGQLAPAHTASSQCQSGQHKHCTCEVCW